jgi:hypothetical protein
MTFPTIFLLAQQGSACPVAASRGIRAAHRRPFLSEAAVPFTSVSFRHATDFFSGAGRLTPFLRPRVGSRAPALAETSSTPAIASLSSGVFTSTGA